MKNFIVIFLIIITFLIIFLSFNKIFLKKADDFQKVNFITKDGVTISGNYYPNKEAKFAGILIHQRSFTKESLEDLAKFLNQEGYAILTIDLRGHGESTNSIFGKLSYKNFNLNDEKKYINDIEAASLFLEKEGYNKEKQFLIGISIGANLSFQFLNENPQIKAVVLFSPGINYRGITLENYKKEGVEDRIFIVISLDDKQSAEAGKVLKERYPKSFLIEYSFGGHGIEILKNHPDIKEKLILWLREKLI